MKLWTVRVALRRLAEEIPISLGDSRLARELLPDERDKLRRGTRVQQALRTAIDHLAPIGARSDRERWAYLICIGEYEERKPRAAVQTTLAISRSTYTRAKLAGLERIAGMLPYLVAGKDVMDDAAWTAYLDTLTPEQRRFAQAIMARVQTILNSDRVGIDADMDAENERIGTIERGRRRSQEVADALHEEVHDLSDRVTELEHPHEAGA